MTVDVKICGCTDEAAVAAAREAGAMFVGFVMYPPSPRNLSPEHARALLDAEGGAIAPLAVAVTVDADDAQLARIVDTLAPNLLQLHGEEPPERVADVRARFGVPVMKAVAIAEASDLDRAERHAEVADRLLFDAKPPKDELPGGNARSFDWSLLTGRAWRVPWLLSGGLTPDTVAAAVRASGAPGVDVSSGVEAERGVKDADAIHAFLEQTRGV